MLPVNCPTNGVVLIRVAQPGAAVRQAAGDPASRAKTGPVTAPTDPGDDAPRLVQRGAVHPAHDVSM